jgi:ABC-type spermidine/putrescine transport system permease subunit I
VSSGAVQILAPPRLRRQVLALPAFVWVGLLVVAPNTILVLYSFWTNRISVVDKTFTLGNYSQAIHSDVVQTLLLRTFLIALVSAACATAIGFPLAYIVVRYFGRFKFLAALLVIVPLWVSFLMRVFSWKIILGENGILNGALVKSGITDQPVSAFLYSPFAVGVTMTYVGIPYVFLASYTLLERIPPNLYEASSDCGASSWQTVRRIVWPIARPAVVVGFMLVFIIVFGDYVTPTLIGGFSGTMMGSVILQAFGGLNNWPFGAALAITTLLAALLFLAATSVFLRRRYVLEE